MLTTPDVDMAILIFQMIELRFGGDWPRVTNYKGMGQDLNPNLFTLLQMPHVVAVGMTCSWAKRACFPAGRRGGFARTGFTQPSCRCTSVPNLGIQNSFHQASVPISTPTPLQTHTNIHSSRPVFILCPGLPWVLTYPFAPFPAEQGQRLSAWG